MIENISTIVIAFSALITACATIVLAVITSRYVRLTDSLLKATCKPQIFVSLRYELFISPTGAGVLCWQRICVKNIDYTVMMAGV